jgi:prepilin-type N-terminal cleavage/methylation domain-containing protein
MRSAERGFTLLEVLAAVALLALAFAPLSGAHIQGLQHEGESLRRIQASLIADQLLAELEASIDAGEVPQPGKQDRSDGDFAIATEVAALDLEVPDDDAATAAPGSAAPQTGLGGKPANRLPDVLSASLLRGSGRTASPIRRVTLRVTWTEGWGERSVTRTTYAFDAQAVQGEIAALDAIAQATAAQSQAATQTPAQASQGAASTPPASGTQSPARGQ